MDDIALKLIRASTMLYKVRYFVKAGILKAIFYALFVSHIHFARVLWGYDVWTINRPS